MRERGQPGDMHVKFQVQKNGPSILRKERQSLLVPLLPPLEVFASKREAQKNMEKAFFTGFPGHGLRAASLLVESR